MQTVTEGYAAVSCLPLYCQLSFGVCLLALVLFINVHTGTSNIWDGTHGDSCWPSNTVLIIQLSDICVFGVQYPGNKAEKENLWAIPALLRLKIWLGLEQYESDWHKQQTEGTLSVYAETVSDIYPANRMFSLCT